MIKNKITF